MPRKEFSRATKRAALERSNHKCEASGTHYGFEPGQRCNCNLSLGVQFDHVLPCELGGDNSLSNCLAICVQCHKHKTRNDIRQIRKSDRQRDRHTGVVRPSGKIKSPGFPAAAHSIKRQPKPPLSPRQLYQETQR